ncbi:MAG TPA: hypothetical protein VF070_11120 [Streptosporangiaceae bacterium]
MTGVNDAGRPSGDLKPEPPGRSRRSLLKGAAAAGAAGIAATALAGGALPAAASSRSAAGPAREAGTAPAGGSEPVVVHVRDAATGEMEVFRGTTCTRMRDAELAARLVRASG